MCRQPNCTCARLHPRAPSSAPRNDEVCAITPPHAPHGSDDCDDGNLPLSPSSHAPYYHDGDGKGAKIGLNAVPGALEEPIPRH
eukprot:2776944-Alexandrium_andersonii.AAC.1